MSKILHISGILAFVAIVAIRVTPYFEGIAFDKYWLIPMGVLPIGLGALLVFCFSAIGCIVSIVRKKRSPQNLYIILSVPILVYLLYLAPLPSYVDGMKKTVTELVTPQELTQFAIDAKLKKPDWNNLEEHTQIISELMEKHQKPLSLSPITPRIEVHENYVTVFYGSALVKHWGYLVGDLEKFPIEHIPENMYAKVYEGVWVYHDIW